MTIGSKPFFCSWSGGKDACLAYYRAVKAGGIPRYLFTMMEDEKRSKSHHLPVELLKKQALSLGVQLLNRSAAWEDYEHVFIKQLEEFKSKGIEDGVFGDIDLEGHKEWVDKVCEGAKIAGHEPLWKCSRRELLKEFIEAGFKAVIIAAKDGVVGKDILGRTLDLELVRYFEKIGIDASGEEGEYHSVVIDGPIFASPIKISLGEQILHDGYWFQEVKIL